MIAYLNNLKNNYKNYLLLFIFSSHFFFWSFDLFKFNLKYLILILIFFSLINLYKKKNFKIIYISLLISILLLLHTFLLYLFFDVTTNIKNIIYCFLPSCFVLIIIEYKNFLIENLNKIILFYIVIFNIFFIFSIYYFYNINNIYPEHLQNFSYFLSNCNTSFFSWTVALFRENSHFGLTSVSVILVSLNNIFIKKQNSQFYIINFILYFLFLYNLFSTTYMIASILISLFLIIYCFYFKYSFKFVIILIFLIIFNLLFFKFSSGCSYKVTQTISTYKSKLLPVIDGANTNSLKDRKESDKIVNLIKEKDSINLSTNVHFYHAINTYIILKYNIFGLGLNNYSFGYYKYQKIVSPLIENKLFLNAEDATNNFFKITGEFGIISLLFYLLPILFILRNESYPHESVFFFLSIYFATMIRGAGYFNNGFMLCVIIMFIEVLRKKNDN